MMKTVAIITPCLGLGGAEQWVRCLVTHCKSFRWSVCVLTDDPRHDLVVNGVVANADLYAPEGFHPRAQSLGNAARNVQAALHGADAVIAWGLVNFWPLPTQAPIVFVGHGTCQWTVHATRLAHDGGANHFVAVSDGSATAMRSVTPSVTTIMNGVDSTRLQTAPDARITHRRWMFDYTRRVGYIGRLANEKNLDSIIHAVASLPHHYQLALIGCTGWRSEQILTLARTVLRDRLVEIPATDNVGDALASCDCIVQVSPREGHSLAICEGLYCGVPIVSNRTGAIPQLEEMAGHELVEHVPDDPLTSEIAAAIRKVCTTPPTRRIESAQKFAREHLTETAMCKKWADYLNTIIDQHARG